MSFCDILRICDATGDAWYLILTPLSFSGEFLRKVRETGDFHNEWYWISQLYDEDWSPDKMD